MRKGHKTTFMSALLLICFGAFAGCCLLGGRTDNQKGGDIGSPNVKRLGIAPITNDVIPDAMQWNRAAVLAASGNSVEDLSKQLRELDSKESDLDSVKIFPVPFLNDREDVHVYLLYGWSSSGLDELRSASLDSAKIEGRDINIYASRPEVQMTGSVMGTADMRFIGWDVNIGRLEAGDYSVNLFIRRDTVKITAKPYSRVVSEGEGYKLRGKVTIPIVMTE